MQIKARIFFQESSHLAIQLSESQQKALKVLCEDSEFS